MYKLHFIIWLCSLVMLANALEFQLAVRSTAGDLVRWGTLQTQPASLNSFQFTPETNDADKVTEGCLGIIEPSGFLCQTLFRRDSSHQALDLVLKPDGSLLQARFTEGPRSSASIQYPGKVPRPVLKPPTQATGGQAKNPQSGAGPTEAKVDTDEPEKSFVEKYWLYALPIGILVISNMISPGRAAE